MPGAFSSLGAVLDAIISMIGNLPAVTSSNPPITVFDGKASGSTNAGFNLVYLYALLNS